MRRLSLFLVLGLVIISLVGCGNSETVKNNTPDQSELNSSKVEQVKKDIRQLLVNSLADVATNLKELKTDDGNTYSIKDPQEWAEYRVSELANLISLTHQLLGDIQDEMRQDQLISYENRWKNEYLSFLNRIKQGDIIAFKNNVNEGFQLATEGICDDNPQKIEQARDMFVKLSEQLPKMSPSKEIMMEDIRSKLLEGYVQVTTEEAKNQSGYDLVIPKYLPERFQHHGIFMRDNPGIPTEKMVKQLWYDPEKFEVLMVTQMKDPSPDREERIIFSDGLETPGKISDIFPWAKYRCQYEFTKNGIHVQGYMLVNDEGNRDEYQRILKSLFNPVPLEEIVEKHIPKPFNPIVHSNSLEFPGRWAGNVIPGFIQEMKKMGWVELEDEQMGAMRYFTKEIDGRKVKISVVPGEKGGPEEENATTFIYFRVLKENER